MVCRCAATVPLPYIIGEVLANARTSGILRAKLHEFIHDNDT